MEYGGLKPILPFLGVRSGAACRVVIRLRGIVRDGYSRAGNFRPAPTAPPLPRISYQTPLMARNVMPFYHDAARRVATVFEKWNCLVERAVPTKGPPHKRLTPYGSFAAVPLMNTAV